MTDKVEKTSPVKFARQVRQEIGKVTWPTRRETIASTAMVLVIAVLAALFFLLVDFLIVEAVQAFLGIGS